MKHKEKFKKIHQFHFTIILLLIFNWMLSSCKTTYSFEFQPVKPPRFVFQGNSLVNRIQTDYQFEKEDKIIKFLLSQLTKLESKFDYIGYINKNGDIPEPIDYVPQPLIMDLLYNDIGYKYLINISATVNAYRKGSFAIGEQDLGHHVNVEITVYETETSRMIYRQEIMLHEEWDYSMEEDLSEKPRWFLLTRSSENLMKIGIKKCTKKLKLNSGKAKKEIEKM